MKRFLLWLIFSALLVFPQTFIQAQYSLTVPSYSQDFNTLANSGASSSLPTGWSFYETGSNANTTYTAGNGSSNTGDTYSFGATASTERAFGSLQSGTLVPMLGFYFTNNTGSTISSLSISYTGEQWRLGATGRIDRMDFQYSNDATSLNNGTWTDVNTLDFTAPVQSGSIGALNGNVSPNQTSIIGSISGLSIANGASFFIRWVDLDAFTSDDGLGIDDLTMTASFSLPSTNYFRSATSGNWDVVSTWEYSSDNVSWSAATIVPTSSANTITIRNGHTVTIAASATADQVVIQNGGKLNHTAGTFTINDGSGDDIDIQNGGVLILSSASNAPQFGSGSPTINIGTGGILRISAGGLTGAGIGVNASNYVYQHQSILEYTLNGGFSSSGVTYFPNVNSTTIPIFRTTNTSNLLVGANNFTSFNGIFEANGAGDVIWQNTGDKIFRNGIRGTGKMLANVSAASAKFKINGLTAELGGTDSLILPTGGGLEVGSGTTVTVTSNKIVIGDISLLSNTYIDVGSNNLTVSGVINGGSANSFVKARGSGLLTLNNVANKVFPIGPTLTSYNPVTINGGQNINYSMRVDTGIVPNANAAFPKYAVNRTWTINTSSLPPSAVTTTFQYDTTHCNSSALPQPRQMEILQLISGTWNIPYTNITPIGNPAPLTFYVAAPITTFNTSFFTAVNGGLVLPINCIISCRAQKQNSGNLITWNVNDCSSVDHFEIERSVNGSLFRTISSANVLLNSNDYAYTDREVTSGNYLYRIKAVLKSSGTKLSNVVSLLNNKAFFITAISPDPVSNNASLIINSGTNAEMQLKITDVNGRTLRQWQQHLAEGVNHIQLFLADLKTGNYFILGESANGRTNIIQFIKQ